MSDSMGYYEDRISAKEDRTETFGKNVQEIIDLVSFLSPLEKVQIKKLLKNLDIFYLFYLFLRKITRIFVE